MKAIRKAEPASPAESKPPTKESSLSLHEKPPQRIGVCWRGKGAA